jgi:hypothetical protein
MTKAYKWSAKKILAALPKEREKLLACKFPEKLQDRAEELLKLSHSGRLDVCTRGEVEQFLKLASDILLLKAKALDSKGLLK